MSSIVNIAAYQFAEISNLPKLRERLYEFCKREQLKGTILLSVEGINLFVAGTRQGVDGLISLIRQIDGLQGIQVKESFSDEQPFNRMLVKIKKEIIAFGVEGIDPRRYSSRRLTPRELKRWLDEGRSVTLLDTRNNFEVHTGTFDNALAIGIDDFREFPQAVEKLPEELKQKTIVTFCTGGIRCEKAAPFLEAHGFQDVYQLDGGILKYFEECGGEHYHGQCFVFDKRVALDSTLQEGGLRQCYVCQAILSAEEQSSPMYVEGRSCPNCYRPETIQMADRIRERQRAIRAVTSPLPGSIPYDNARPMSVPLRLDRAELLDFLTAVGKHLSREEWLSVCENGRLICNNQPARPGQIVRAGERYLHLLPATIEPDVNPEIKVLHEDDAIVVINKPAPLPMHPCGRFNRNTLSYILDQAFHPICLRPAHRLDADTSGVVVFSKTAKVARRVQSQFERGEVTKIYLARVHGQPSKGQFECHLPLSNAPGLNGVRLPDEKGLQASTRFESLHHFEDGTSLVSAQPLTGRTNQIRAHLWSMGLPIVGDPIYLPGGQLGVSKALSTTEGPLCLHAASIEFVHPVSNSRIRFESSSPAWAERGTSQSRRSDRY